MAGSKEAETRRGNEGMAGGKTGDECFPESWDVSVPRTM